MRSVLALLGLLLAFSVAAYSACGSTCKSETSAGAGDSPTNSSGAGGQNASSSGDEDPQILVTVGAYSISAVAVADEWVYFTSRGYVWRVRKDATTTTRYTTLAEIQAGSPVAPWDGVPWPRFAITSTHVCWPDRGNITCLSRAEDQLLTIALDGAFSESACVGTDGSELFMAAPTCQKVARISASHEVVWVKDIDTNDDAGSVATLGDGDFVYCASDSTIFRLGRTDGEISVFASDLRDGGPMAQTQAELVWLEGNRIRPPQELRALRKDNAGGTARLIADTGTHVGFSGTLLIDNPTATAFFTRFDTVVSVRLTGGPLSEIWADSVQLRSLAMDDENLYVATMDSATSGIEGRVLRLPRPE
jgi:hypothetical protein